MWRFSLGTPSYAASPSPYNPRLKVSPPRLLTAVVTNTRSPHTIGLECASPGILDFHAMLVPRVTSQFTGNFWPSATPDADGPRNCGQFCAAGGNASRNGINRARGTRRVYQPSVCKFREI